jgi:hypothetical protein
VELINKPRLLLIVVVLVFGCGEQVKRISIEGDFVVTNSSIFLTDGRDAKEELFKDCISKTMKIKNKKLNMDTTCGLFDEVKDVTITDSFITTIDKFPILNPTSFSFFIDHSDSSRKEIIVFKAREVFFHGGKDSMYVVKKSADTIFIVQEPYILELVRCGR